MNIKAVFHIDEISKWELLLGNVSNLIRATEIEAYQVEVLANSEAVRNYIRNEQNKNLAKMLELAQQGIHFAACNNSLKKMGIDPLRLLPFVHIVPVGVLELIQKQAEGYAYIKP
jgi:uncharacterized protein